MENDSIDTAHCPPAKNTLAQVVSPPGTFLEEELVERGMTQSHLAKLLVISEKSLSLIINGKQALAAETALKLEALWGISAQFWLNMETRYRLRLGEDSDAVRAKAVRARLARLVSLSELEKKAKIPKWLDSKALEALACNVLGVTSLDEAERMAIPIKFNPGLRLRHPKIFTPTDQSVCGSSYICPRLLQPLFPKHLPKRA